MAIFDLFTLYISVVSICSVLLLALGKFNFYLPLIIAGALLFTILRAVNIKISLKDIRFDRIIFLILLSSLILRTSPYLYVLGGQDEGTYVNISKQYELNGTLYTTDTFRYTLTYPQQKLYDRFDNYFMPSIEMANADKSQFSMLFYPLHPSWMAIFGGIFGSDNRVYSLTMFSLLSIVGFYLLGYELSGRKKLAGYLAALFMVVNPLHVFFSNFPVGEMVALAFTSLSFYYLVKYYNDAKEGNINIFPLVLSVLLMNGFFYTRMSSFMYLPFFYFLIAVVILFVKQAQIKKHLLIYLGGLFGLCFISYIFYYLFFYKLIYAMYDAYVVENLVDYTSVKLGIMVVSSILFLFLVDALNSSKVFFKFYAQLKKFFPVIFGLIFCLIFYLSYKNFATLGFNTFVSDQRWNMENLGFKSIIYIPLFTIFQYVSPIGLILAILATIYFSWHKKSDNLIIILGVFNVVFLMANVMFVGHIRYHYYNVRYLFSESVPYLLLTTALFVSELYKMKKWKIVASICLFLIIIYFLIFSSIQFFGKEIPDLSFYKNIESIVNKDGLLLIYKRTASEPPLKYAYNFNTYALGPLKYYYGYNTFILLEPYEVYTTPIKSVISRFKNVYMISDANLDSEPFLKNKNVIKLTYNYFNTPKDCTKPAYDFLPIDQIKSIGIPNNIGCFLPPSAYYVTHRDFYLYKVEL